MELIVVKGALGLDVAGALGDGEDAVGDVPFRRLRAVLGGNPFVEMFSREENDGVGGWLAAFRSGGNYLGLRLPDLSVFRFGGGLLGVDWKRRQGEKGEEKQHPELGAHGEQEDTTKWRRFAWATASAENQNPTQSWKKTEDQGGAPGRGRPRRLSLRS